ncbi:MAG: 2-C-methyl-D-erythritol 4-phosphate cytidylyltransferase [Oscillospiraceae bacterium]|nr:2-C-methyl-D-erythritol 4-phosphate cytidylyltransferase [Candidatus Equicaccousia limihippi]
MPILQSKPKPDICGEGAAEFTAVILAAGSSTRFGEDKQFLNIAGIPCIARSMLAFERHPQIKSIVVVTKEDKILPIQNLADKYEITKITDIIKGGDTRFLSVQNALSYVDTEYLLIHDGARPLVSQKIISDVINAVVLCGGAIPCLPITDTVKRVDKSGYIAQTYDRNALVRVQTPQGFITADYKAAASQNGDHLITDDSAVFENAGYRVKTVEGSYENIKITVREDIITAENLLKEQGETL